MKPYLQDPDLTVYNGEALATLRELPDACVDCVVTSPPYWGLRDYGTASWEGGDPDCEHVGQVARTAPPGTEKQASNAGSNGVRAGDCACGARRIDQQIGLEASLEEYVEALVEVFREVRRVLRKHGTVWLNIGDSYSGAALGSFNGGGFKDRSARTGGRDLSGVETSGQMDKVAGSGLKPKDLCLIPARVALALQADGWYVRSDVIWDKPNPMPSSVTDRPTTTHEYLYMLTKAPRYYFDQDAVREPYSSENGTNGSESVERLTLGDLPPEAPRGVDGRRQTKIASNGAGVTTHENYANRQGGERWPESGRNVRTVWRFPTQPFPGAHFAVFPAELPRRCISASTSEVGYCPVCRAPWERQVEVERPDLKAFAHRRSSKHDPGMRRNDANAAAGRLSGQEFNRLTKRTEIGWRPTCSCGEPPVPGVVLDPFGGSGTVGLVARKLGRHAILIELSTDFCGIIAERTQQLSLEALA